MEARTISSTILREFCEADAQEINRLAVTAFEEFGCNYSDWPALAAFYGKMSDLAKSGEIVVAEIGGFLRLDVGYGAFPEGDIVRAVGCDAAVYGVITERRDIRQKVG